MSSIWPIQGQYELYMASSRAIWPHPGLYGFIQGYMASTGSYTGLYGLYRVLYRAIWHPGSTPCRYPSWHRTPYLGHAPPRGL